MPRSAIVGAKKILFYTASNVASVVQFGGIGALEGSQDCIETFRTELRARRDLFFTAASRRRPATSVLPARPPAGAFYAFLRIDPSWNDPSTSSGQIRTTTASASWRMVEYLIKNGRIGCVPGVDFGANGEGYVRFCFARDRKELTGALDSMKQLFAVHAQQASPRSASSMRRSPRTRSFASHSGLTPDPAATRAATTW